MINLKDFLFNKLPSRIQRLDRLDFTDQLGQGLLQRWLQIMGSELDENTIKHLEELPNIKDPMSLSSLTSENRDDLLSYIAYEVGSPPDPTKNLNDYKRLCKYSMIIRKYRGSVTGYQLFFKVYGYNVTIDYPTQRRGYDVAQYDVNSYDEPVNSHMLTDYSITLTDQNPFDPHPISTDQLALFKQAVELYLQPIIMNLLDFQYSNSASSNIIQWPQGLQSNIPVINILILQ
jgi:hypothetical protein